MNQFSNLSLASRVPSVAAPLEIRDATPRDAATLAEIVNIAAEGLSLAMWTEMAGPGGDPWEVGRSRARRDTGGFSWTNARICERHGENAGALVGYRIGAPSDPDAVDVTPAVFRPLIHLEGLVAGTFYINVLATFPAHRRAGIARALIEDAAARADGADLSLIVASGNARARAVYDTLGFSEIASAPASAGFGWTPQFTDWILLRRAS